MPAPWGKGPRPRARQSLRSASRRTRSAHVVWSEQSTCLLGRRGPHDEDRAGRVVDKVSCRAAEQKALEAVEAPAADHRERRTTLLAQRDELMRCPTLTQLLRHRLEWRHHARTRLVEDPLALLARPGAQRILLV